VLEGLWEFAQPVHMCFVDLEKAFDRVLVVFCGECSCEYGVRGPLLRAVRSLYDRAGAGAWFALPAGGVPSPGGWRGPASSGGVQVSRGLVHTSEGKIERERLTGGLVQSVRSYAVGVPDRRGEEGAGVER
ncbi:hypothetical protein L3Q82_015562, partial [Scortum barcoo]